MTGERPPNVVLILSDDRAWTDYGFLGHDAIHTPRLDALARQSVVFPRGYTPSSLCRPSLMTMITGLYPHQHGVTGNDPPRGVDRGAMLKHVEERQPEEFATFIQRENDQRRIAGFSPIYSLLRLIEAEQGQVLRYDRGITDQYNSTVTYASMAFF